MVNTPFWFTNLAFWSAQVALLALAGGYLPQLFQIRQPRVLLIYWRALIAVSLLLPFVQPWSEVRRIETIAIDPSGTSVGIRIGSGANAMATAGRAASNVASHWHFPSVAIVAEIIAVIIILGIAARFAMLGLGLVKLRQFRRASTSLPAGVAAAAVLDEMRVRVNTGGEFRLSLDVDSPVTFGLANPVILLPEKFPSLDSQYQAAIACHELLHVRRRDWAHQLTEEFFRGALWFHPAIGWLVARVRLTREQVVDQEVIRLTAARKPYLEALFEFTNCRALSAAMPASSLLAERQLAERVALMLKEIKMSKTRLIASLSAMIAVVAIAAIFGAWAFPLKGAVSIIHPRSAVLTPDELTIRPATRWETQITSTSNAKLAPGQKQPPTVTVTIKSVNSLKPLSEKRRKEMIDFAQHLLAIANGQAPTQGVVGGKPGGVVGGVPGGVTGGVIGGVITQAPTGKAYRAGQDGVGMPTCVYCPRPEFTEEAKKAHTGGTIYLEVTVLENGRAGNVTVRQGLGNGLDERAIETVKNQWTFQPAQGSDGKPVATIVPVQVPFELWGPPPPAKIGQAVPKTNNDADTKIFTEPVTGDGETTPYYMGKVKTETIYGPPPVFPVLARQLKMQEGSVYLNIIVDKEGKVIAEKVERATAPVFIQAAMEAVQTWKIKGTHDGEPVSFQTVVEVDFTLHGEQKPAMEPLRDI